ncbi:MAG TPA: VPLPA-CTERM sorting domain-containing protein [Thiohalobacter sp.]|nr:VPLPA-CTERM sorting domain-containing protein [Thiohalobacter sp.]
MKRVMAFLFAAFFTQQVSAVSTVAGIDFIAIADTLDASVGSFDSNSANGVTSSVDGNAASYIYSGDDPASVDISFGGGLFDTGEVDLTLLFVGGRGHAGTVTLLGGSSAGSAAGFNIADGENYTGHNSEMDPSLECTSENGCFGIYAATIDLSGFAGTFSGIRLDIGGSSAVPSLVGTTAPAAVPVPAAVWLFGSGLLGLVGVARRRDSAGRPE